MQWIKGLCLFSVSFGVVFCAVCFASAETASSSGAASSTVTNALERTLATVKSGGAVVFAKTEEFRRATAAYFSEKHATAAAVRAAKWESIVEEEVDVDKLLVAEPKSVMDQVRDTSGLVESIKIQTYKALAFVFGTVYVFYGIIALFVLWLLRRIFRRSRGY